MPAHPEPQIAKDFLERGLDCVARSVVRRPRTWLIAYSALALVSALVAIKWLDFETDQNELIGLDVKDLLRRAPDHVETLTTSVATRFGQHHQRATRLEVGPDEAIAANFYRCGGKRSISLTVDGAVGLFWDSRLIVPGP